MRSWPVAWPQQAPAGTSLIPSTSIPGAETMNAALNTTGMPNTNTAALAPKPQPSVWTRMARNPETWRAAAQMIAGATEGASRNRSSVGDVQRAEYVAGGGRPYQPAAGLPSYGFGPQASGDKVRNANLPCSTDTTSLTPASSVVRRRQACRAEPRA
jgi:hypothetical protein